MNVSLDSLPHAGILSGVDYCNKGDADGIRFILNGETYEIYEDPEDGYRSSCYEFTITSEVVKNTFLPCEVIIEYIKIIYFEGISIMCKTSGKTILTAGTDTSDDYYPSAILTFYPENLIYNNL